MIMRCCVPFCRNTPERVSKSAGKGKKITFHSFPSEADLCTAWLKALGIQHTHLPDSPVVCSQHFLSDDIYDTENGRLIGAGAIPSTVQVCMICLDSDREQILMSKHKLEEAYENLTGHPLSDSRNLKQTLCLQCAQRLISFSRFRDKSLRASSLMMDLVDKHEFITIQNVKIINRAKYQLKCNFVSTTLGPDHCDLHIVERPDKDILTESEETVGTLVVKKEQCSNSMLVDEDMDFINEDDNYADNSHEELVVSHEENSISDESIMFEVKLLDDDLLKALNGKSAPFISADAEQGAEDPLKAERVTSRCTLGYENLPGKQEFTEHNMSMHLQSIAGASEHQTPKVRRPRTAVGSGCSAHIPEHEWHAVQQLEDDSYPSADLAQPAVAPLPARLANKSKRVLALNDGELENQSSNSNNKTNTDYKRLPNCVVKLNDICKVLKKTPKTVSSRDSQNIDTAYKDSHCQAASESEVPATENTPNILNTSQRSEEDSDCPNNDMDIQINNSLEILVPECQYKCKRHMKSHTGEKPYSCNLCEYKCAKNSHLVQHMQTHTGNKPYCCKLCEYKFARNHDLVRHIRTHTGEKPFSCKLCEYKCVQKSALMSHMRKHTGEKPYSCKLCEFKCAQKGSLVPHMRTHTGEKPYSCKLCEFKCAHNGSLVLHMRTHSGEKPFSCKLCEYKCALKHHLVSHMLTHTG